MVKKILRVVSFLVFIIIGLIFIKIGLHFQETSSSKYIYKTGIDAISIKLEEIFKIDKKYQLGDDFKVTGKVDINLTSEEYQNKQLYDVEYKKKNNLINNLSKMDINYSLNQSKKEKKQLITIDEKINGESILNYNYFVEDSTKYYYIDNIINSYINAGNNNYFEIFNENETTISNFKYMYEFVKNALAKELAEKSTSSIKKTTINNKQKELNQLSIQLTNKNINDILNGILEDIKADQKANKIMNNIDNNFSKEKINYEKLEKNESITLNIYSSRFLNKPLKYEIIYMNKDKKKEYSYEGDYNNGNLYYLENDNIKYMADISLKNKEITINVYDKNHKDAGNIKINKDINSTIMNVSLNINDKNYDIVYSKKYKNLKKKKSYDIEKELTVKIANKKEVKIAGKISSIDKIEKEVVIDNIVDNSVLMSRLSDSQKEIFNNLYNNVKNKIEN